MEDTSRCTQDQRLSPLPDLVWSEYPVAKLSSHLLMPAETNRNTSDDDQNSGLDTAMDMVALAQRTVTIYLIRSVEHNIMWSLLHSYMLQIHHSIQ